MTLLRTTSQSDYELRLPQERVKYAMLGGSKVVVGTSIASYDRTHSSRCCDGPPPRLRPSEPSHLSMTLHATSQSDYELRSPQERVKYVMLGGSKVVVGTSIASYDLMRASWCCDGPPPRPRPLRSTSALQLSTRPPNVIMRLDCPKSTVVWLSCPIDWSYNKRSISQHLIDGAYD